VGPASPARPSSNIPTLVVRRTFVILLPTALLRA
jgi:hypothetical protein